ncbi:hypothetical protein GCM10009559_09300 [Pseudonocardia zijingensis]|uniref:Uncharacterized protein n=1 Tax=Pseudonocardia zijingensis TaxID=153376 RepID=A0ABP3ZN51_9PSEU
MARVVQGVGELRRPGLGTDGEVRAHRPAGGGGQTDRCGGQRRGPRRPLGSGKGPPSSHESGTPPVLLGKNGAS